MAKPEKIRIPYEDFDSGRFQYVGRYDIDKQFMAFVTKAFPDDNKYPSPNSYWQSIKRLLAIIHYFDAEGNHISSDIRLGGYEAEGDIAHERTWNELGNIFEVLATKKPIPCDIYVKPFSIEMDGITYGLIYEQYDDNGEAGEYVMLEPNDIMFCEPWDSGDYST